MFKENYGWLIDTLLFFLGGLIAYIIKSAKVEMKEHTDESTARLEDKWKIAHEDHEKRLKRIETYLNGRLK